MSTETEKPNPRGADEDAVRTHRLSEEDLCQAAIDLSADMTRAINLVREAEGALESARVLAAFGHWASMAVLCGGAGRQLKTIAARLDRGPEHLAGDQGAVPA
jgi:hypothetical protein